MIACTKCSHGNIRAIVPLGTLATLRVSTPPKCIVEQHPGCASLRVGSPYGL
jgi:hypothetical protein